MSTDRLLGGAMFVAIVAVFFLLGDVAGFRAGGVATVVFGLFTMRQGELAAFGLRQVVTP